MGRLVTGLRSPEGVSDRARIRSRCRRSETRSRRSRHSSIRPSPPAFPWGWGLRTWYRSARCTLRTRAPNWDWSRHLPGNVRERPARHWSAHVSCGDRGTGPVVGAPDIDVIAGWRSALLSTNRSPVPDRGAGELC